MCVEPCTDSRYRPWLCTCVLQFVVYAVMVVVWFSSPVMRVPPSWFWPMSYAIALPGHPVGTVGIVAWIAACQLGASWVASLLHAWLKRQRHSQMEALRLVVEARSDSGSSKKDK